MRYVACKINSYVKLFFALLTAACLMTSIASYHSDDISFNTSSNVFTVKNLLGYIGSYFADLLIQFFGVSSFFFILLIFIYYIKKIFIHARFISSILYLIYTIAIVLSISALATAMNICERYYNGGVLGIIFFRYDSYIFVFIIMISIIGLMGWRKSSTLIYKIMARLLSKMFAKIKVDYSVIKDISPPQKKKITLFKRINESNIEVKVEEINPCSSFKIKSNFLFPSTNLLTKSRESNRKQIEDNNVMILLEEVLRDFGVQGNIVNVRYGPVVTLYELSPSAGTKSSRVIGLADDIARSMSALSTRISVIPGRNVIGIELPNQDREIVMLRDLFETEEYKNSQLKLPIALGKGIDGEPIIADLAKMPHLLVAGTTGSGKSVAINTMILSLIYRLTPDNCKMIMIDPKMLELSIYDSIPHLLTPVVTEPKKAITALKWVVREMENRYRSMSILGVRNIIGYNEKVAEAISNGIILEKNLQTGFDKATGKPIFEKIALKTELFPYIVVIVDEMADLMLVAGKEIESSIQRLAQMARAAGIHIIMATQRPSVDVITGVIKANFPTRISFAVTSKIDSRTILGEQGAEQLLGMGDMLYMISGGKIVRVHGPFVSDSEVQDVVNHLKLQGIPPSYMEDIIKDEDDSADNQVLNGYDDGDKDSELYNKAVEIVLKDRKASTSYVQRQLRIGYNRAANLIERMEKEGLVTEANNLGRREIIAS